MSNSGQSSQVSADLSATISFLKQRFADELIGYDGFEARHILELLRGKSNQSSEQQRHEVSNPNEIHIDEYSPTVTTAAAAIFDKSMINKNDVQTPSLHRLFFRRRRRRSRYINLNGLEFSSKFAGDSLNKFPKDFSDNVIDGKNFRKKKSGAANFERNNTVRRNTDNGIKWSPEKEESKTGRDLISVSFVSSVSASVSSVVSDFPVNTSTVNLDDKMATSYLTETDDTGHRYHDYLKGADMFLKIAHILHYISIAILGIFVVQVQPT